MSKEERDHIFALNKERTYQIQAKIMKKMKTEKIFLEEQLWQYVIQNINNFKIELNKDSGTITLLPLAEST